MFSVRSSPYRWRRSEFFRNKRLPLSSLGLSPRKFPSIQEIFSFPSIAMFQPILCVQPTLAYLFGQLPSPVSFALSLSRASLPFLLQHLHSTSEFPFFVSLYADTSQQLRRCGGDCVFQSRTSRAPFRHPLGERVRPICFTPPSPLPVESKTLSILFRCWG